MRNLLLLLLCDWRRFIYFSSMVQLPFLLLMDADVVLSCFVSFHSNDRLCSAWPWSWMAWSLSWAQCSSSSMACHAISLRLEFSGPGFEQHVLVFLLVLNSCSWSGTFGLEWFGVVHTAALFLQNPTHLLTTWQDISGGSSNVTTTTNYYYYTTTIMTTIIVVVVLVVVVVVEELVVVSQCVY